MSLLYSSLFKLIDPDIISHSPKSNTYKLLKNLLNFVISFKKKSNNNYKNYSINPSINNIKLKKYSFSAFKTEDLMNLEELIMIKYYFNNKKFYSNFLDLGASIGIHTVIASKIGFNVESYEPDKKHYKQLLLNCRVNKVKNVKSYEKAVYKKKCKLTFVNVKNNTTSNHVLGFKKKLYGPISRTKVDAVKADNLFKRSDLVKMDIEGAEYEVLKSICKKNWNSTDCFVSVHNDYVAKKIFNHFKKIKINMFSSKINWQKIKKFDDLPTCHAEGLLFISKKNKMNWEYFN